ncbi:hypothetical protein BS17DRAFT_767054 [Gyrodon lividus]|nr:hypothetical protein BS17DRAFT_767054 [Gyrodon lividus]
MAFETMNAGSWHNHNHFPAETHVQLDLARLASFYNTQLVPSLVSIRAGQEGWDYRVQNTSGEDISSMGKIGGGLDQIQEPFKRDRLDGGRSRPLRRTTGIDAISISSKHTTDRSRDGSRSREEDRRPP